jgi:hypothetical protein
MRKFKITSSLSPEVTYAHTTLYLERTLSALARQAHPKSPITITVEDVTEDQTRLKVGKPDWAKGP